MPDFTNPGIEEFILIGIALVAMLVAGWLIARGTKE